MNPYLVGVVKDAAKFTPAQTVKVVRRGNSTEIKKSSSSSSLQVAGYSALGMGTAGIAYAVSRSGKLSVPVPNIRGLDKILGKEHRFVQGVVLATAVCSALGFAVAHRIQAAASIQAGFSKYPPYKKAAIAAPSHFTTGFLAPKEYKKLTLVKKEVSFCNLESVLIPAYHAAGTKRCLHTVYLGIMGMSLDAIETHKYRSRGLDVLSPDVICRDQAHGIARVRYGPTVGLQFAGEDFLRPKKPHGRGWILPALLEVPCLGTFDCNGRIATRTYGPASRDLGRTAAMLNSRRLERLTMSATWSPPKGYENRPVAVLGGGVLGRRIGKQLPSSAARREADK
ncbi:hypothetical protein M8818_003569 [Zalaria obscura]|uniref:Uncharacterized protein n=1 Tax=Zalaria obscura TaxID=2024903 RepID=A0ACC3SF74_9PEZI